MLLNITVAGRPAPLKRSRSRDGQAQHYDPPENVAAKEKIQWATRWNKPIITSPLYVELWFLYVQANPTADVDNLAKLVLDAYNGYVWKDDRQILDLVVHKRGGQIWDQTIIHISEFKETA